MVSSPEDMQNMAILVAGGVFAFAGLALIFRPRRVGHSAKVEFFGLKFESSSAGVLVFIVGAAFLAFPSLLARDAERAVAAPVDPGLPLGTVVGGEDAGAPPTDASDWALVGSDTFSDGQTNWSLLERTNDDTARITEERYYIFANEYRWDFDLAKRASQWMFSPYGSAVNFYATTEFEFVSAPDGFDTAMGLVFGASNDLHYYFLVGADNDNGDGGLSYALHFKDAEGDVSTILDWIVVPDDLAEANRLSVIVQRGIAKLYINDRFLADYALRDYAGGRVGLVAQGYGPGAFVYDFDNFEFRRAPETP